MFRDISKYRNTASSWRSITLKIIVREFSVTKKKNELNNKWQTYKYHRDENIGLYQHPNQCFADLTIVGVVPFLFCVILDVLPFPPVFPIASCSCYNFKMYSEKWKCGRIKQFLKYLHCPNHMIYCILHGFLEF